MTDSKFALYISIASLITFLFVAFFRKEGKTEIHKPVTEQMQPIAFKNAKTIPLPQRIDLAGEEVPLDIDDVKERLDKELHINSYWHNNTIFLFKRANRWFPVIEPILKENGIPDDFKYLALIESGLENVDSYAGAAGFWQILKSTGREYGLEINRDLDQRYHPVLSTKAACKYLKRSYDKFGNWTLVAASYNRGMRGIQDALDNQKVDNFYDLKLNDETSRYVFRILAIKQIFESPEDYGLDISKEHLFKHYVYRYDTVKNSTNWIDYAKEKGTNYKTLRIYNPWIQDDDIRIGRDEYYVISLPAGS
jgi:hypothetical protein